MLSFCVCVFESLTVKWNLLIIQTACWHVGLKGQKLCYHNFLHVPSPMARLGTPGTKALFCREVLLFRLSSSVVSSFLFHKASHLMQPSAEGLKTSQNILHKYFLNLMTDLIPERFTEMAAQIDPHPLRV